MDWGKILGGAIKQGYDKAVPVVTSALAQAGNNMKEYMSPQRIVSPISESLQRPSQLQQEPLPITIRVPSRNGEEMVLPQEAAVPIFEAFDRYGEATNAAQVLHHPSQISGLPSEIARGVNTQENIGENPTFNPLAVNKNPNGTIDTGLMQVNSETFDDLMKHDYWRGALERRGITSYEDMKDPHKNALTAMLILMRGNYNNATGSMKEGIRNWIQWYSAPREFRSETYAE